MKTKILLLLVLFTTSLVGCGSSKQKLVSSDHMKSLSTAVMKYHDEKNAWPDSLDQVKPMIGQQYMGKAIGDGKDYAELLKNPYTGDDPGYEYEKPADAHAIELYQLRGGKRDLSLPVCYADGSVREKDSPGP